MRNQLHGEPSPREIIFAVPGTKHYESEHYCNERTSFANISVTGKKCMCLCKHCRAKTLEDMIALTEPEDFQKLVDSLVAEGCKGILVSGGSDMNGEVPISAFVKGIGYARQKGLKVLVHSGLISKKTAGLLKNVGVNQVLMDIIGDEQTIQEIYHLKKTPQDYHQAMENCLKVGLDFVPHIVLGLYYGQINGEYSALEMIRQASPRTAVLVAFKPLRGTPMENVAPLDILLAKKFIADAREKLKDMKLTLGCAKPPGKYKQELEKTAVECGLDAIAFPSESTYYYAKSLGYKIIFREECCCACFL